MVEGLRSGRKPPVGEGFYAWLTGKAGQKRGFWIRFRIGSVPRFVSRPVPSLHAGSTGHQGESGGCWQ